MSGGDSAWPGGFDSEYGTESDYQTGFWDNFDGNGNGFWTVFRKVENARTQMQVFAPRVLGQVTGVSYNNSNSATSLLNSTITVPAGLLRDGSILEVWSRGTVTLNSGSPTLALTAKLGSVSYALGTTTAFTASANLHQYIVRLCFTANTVGASGDIHITGDWRVSAATTSAFDVNSVSVLGGGSNTVDTTANQAFDLQATMSVANAANSIVSGVTTLTHIPFIG